MIWIDYGTSYPLAKTGLGPITSVSQFRMTTRLDRAGEFSFTMPASDEKANDLAPKMAIVAYTDSIIGPVEIGWGIIESIKVQVKPNQPTMLDVSGTDFMHMLQNVSVRDLALYDENLNDPSLVAIQPTGTILFDGATWGTVTFDVDTYAKWFYVQSTKQFHAVSMDIDTGNTVAGSMLAQYYDGTGWVNISMDDGTSNGGTPYAQSGTVSFTPPANWTELSSDYIVRFHASADTSTVTLGSPYVKVLQYEPTPDALSKISAYFPTGWSYDSVNGGTATIGSVYLSMSGESVLQSLNKVAEQTGEHFVSDVPTWYEAGPYQVKWLGTAQLDSGYRIAAPQEGSTGPILPVTMLERDQSTYDYISRVIPYGGGQGDSRITLAHSTRTPVAGYTMSTANNTLEVGTPTYGTVERAFQWPEIVAATNTGDQLVEASNSLYDRAYETLQRLSQLQTAYRVSCVSPYHVLEPGKTVRLVYREVVDNYVVANIDADLWLLEVTANYRQIGAVEYDLLVSTVDRWPTTDAEMLVANLGKQETNITIVTPDNGLEDAGAGVYMPLSVSSGKVTAGSRVVPYPDGRWGPVDFITIRNGIVTNIESS